MKWAAVVLVSVFALGQDAPPRSVWDGVYSQDQAQRGQALYNQHCMACHGGSLTGGEQAPPLAGGDFLSNWNGLTVGDLFERIRTTMPLNNPQSLNRDTNALKDSGVHSQRQSIPGGASGTVQPHRGAEADPHHRQIGRAI